MEATTQAAEAIQWAELLCGLKLIGDFPDAHSREQRAQIAKDARAKLEVAQNMLNRAHDRELEQGRVIAEQQRIRDQQRAVIISLHNIIGKHALEMDRLRDLTINSECDKLLALSDEQVRALAAMTGDPADIAALKTKLAIQKALTKHAERRLLQLHEALRKFAIRFAPKKKGLKQCHLCHMGAWAGMAELHRPDCLAAPDALQLYR